MFNKYVPNKHLCEGVTNVFSVIMMSLDSKSCCHWVLLGLLTMNLLCGGEREIERDREIERERDYHRGTGAHKGLWLPWNWSDRPLLDSQSDGKQTRMLWKTVSAINH